MAVLKADPEYRRKMIVVFVALVVVGAVVIQWGLPALEAYLKGRRPEEALHIVQALLVVLFLPLLPWAFYFYRFGRRILMSGRFPPPGTKVIRDTEMLEGKVARRRAYLIMILSAWLAAVALVAMFYIPYMLGKSFAPKDVHQESNRSLRLTGSLAAEPVIMRGPRPTPSPPSPQEIIKD